MLFLKHGFRRMWSVYAVSPEICHRFLCGGLLRGIMSSCQGNLAATAKVDREMLEFVDSEADRLGINRAEFMRRLLELYRESRRENTDCPHCGGTVQFDLRA